MTDKRIEVPAPSAVEVLRSNLGYIMRCGTELLSQGSHRTKVTTNAWNHACAAARALLAAPAPMHDEVTELRALLADIVAFDGVSHDDPRCPEDDTCICDNARRIRAALAGVVVAPVTAARAEAWRLAAPVPASPAVPSVVEALRAFLDWADDHSWSYEWPEDEREQADKELEQLADTARALLDAPVPAEPPGAPCSTCAITRWGALCSECAESGRWDAYRAKVAEQPSAGQKVAGEWHDRGVYDEHRARVCTACDQTIAHVVLERGVWHWYAAGQTGVGRDRDDAQAQADAALRAAGWVLR